MAKRPKIRSNENIFKSREVKRHINYTSLTGNRQDICDPYNGIWDDCDTICPSTGYIKGDVNADGNFDILDIIQNVNYILNSNNYSSIEWACNIWAMDVTSPMKGKYISQSKLSVTKPVLFITGRQHANEVSSTSHILKLVELILKYLEY